MDCKRMTKAELIQRINAITHDRDCREADAEKAHNECRAAKSRENSAIRERDSLANLHTTIQSKIDRAKAAIHQELRIRYGAGVALQYEEDARGWVTDNIKLDDNPAVNILRHLHAILEG